MWHYSTGMKPAFVDVSEDGDRSKEVVTTMVCGIEHGTTWDGDKHPEATIHLCGGTTMTCNINRATWVKRWNAAMTQGNEQEKEA